MIELYKYQEKNALKLKDMIILKKIVAFVGEVRTGKTLTSLRLAQMLGCKKVLFVTKKKAIKSIEGDFAKFNPNYELIVINYESLHKVDSSNIDMLIADESHRFSSFPKPSKWAKDLREILSKNVDAYTILLSGTFSPESYSQVYHQFWISPFSPFNKYISFYKWSHDYVDIRKKRIGSFFVNDYSFAYEDLIKSSIEGNVLSFTQEQAGFKSKAIEEIIYIQPHVPTLKLINTLKKDKIIEGNNDVIIADSGAKMQQKVHQLFSGTIKLDSGKRIVLNHDKAKYIHKHLSNRRLAIIYKFVAERDALLDIFKDSITDDLDTFHNSNTLHFMGQVSSVKEGTNLSQADLLVMYNIDFSATSYFQARARLSTKDRPETLVKWIFTKGGIEDSVYKAVSKKKDYTLSYFKDFIKEL